MPSDQKGRKDKQIKYKIAKQGGMDTVDPTTQIKDTHCMGRDVENAARQITLQQYAEVHRQKAVHEVEQELDGLQYIETIT